MEDLQNKVDRLEFYIGLLRNIAQSPDEFALLDWVIANHLDEHTYEQLMSILKEANQYLISRKETGDGEVMSVHDLSVQLLEVLERNNIPHPERQTKHVIRSAARLPGFLLFDYYVEQL
ncbi:hypothetical protein [Paenibacillus bovis]|uniref:DUF1878 domain-containing protein n=1 Tax=Paenibacillus bovis TaxID=1616788 RepID=A0A172ZF57_9BACL|nr:hypothetical protein [Paenibacillus bovis]ANF95790.1 hypothetical protein AR543_07080 [Paenibacillus bovis]